jgi:hypothetical protein
MSDCGSNKKMTGGSLASDMVMDTVKGQHDEPYDFLPSANCGSDTSAFKGVNQTAGGLAKSMIKRHRKLMRHSKTKKHSRHNHHNTKKHSRHHHSKSHRRSHNKKTNTTVMKKSATRKSQKNVMRKMPTMKMPMMMGGGSDWMSSQYSQGPLNDNSDLSGYFSTSCPSSKGMLRNPPNLASAGSGAPMDFFGAGSPL